MKYQEIEGDLIKLAKEGIFDVIAQGCNCWNRQKSGVAKVMVEGFNTNDPTNFTLEADEYYGDMDKLGNIESVSGYETQSGKDLVVTNCYTQFKIKKFNDIDYEYTTTEIPFDYDAFALCMKKINHKFKGKHIGLPQIGSHLAGGHWPTIKEIIQTELRDCEVTIVIFKQ